MTEDPLAPSTPGRVLLSSAQIHHVIRVEFGRSRRHGYPLTCLVIAIDKLERLRDRAGYEAKERVLDAVVALLRRATRSSDSIGRTPDDRLIAIIPHTEGEGTRNLCRRILELARAIRIDLAEAFEVSLSIGAASTHAGVSIYHDALLEAAETALADAVTAGGNRFVERESGPSAP
ncbi:MAG: GGDEF domain-containing protein [Planctomycetota bacterium]